MCIFFLYLSFLINILIQDPPYNIFKCCSRYKFDTGRNQVISCLPTSIISIEIYTICALASNLCSNIEKAVL